MLQSTTAAITPTSTNDTATGLMYSTDELMASLEM